MGGEATKKCWSGRSGLNRRPPAPKAGALPLGHAPMPTSATCRARRNAACPAIPVPHPTTAVMILLPTRHLCCKGMPPGRLERPPPAPEAGALSAELRGHTPPLYRRPHPPATPDVQPRDASHHLRRPDHSPSRTNVGKPCRTNPRCPPLRSAKYACSGYDKMAQATTGALDVIKTLQLRNFKAFENTGNLAIKPITVLAGPNSGGKSSILQSLLLLKQTLEGPPEIELNLDGRYAQFSSFNELTFGKPPLSRCDVSFVFELETPMPREVVPDYFSELKLPEDSETVTLCSTIELSFRYKRRDKESAVVLDHFKVLSEVQGREGPSLSGTLRNRNYRIVTTGRGIELPETLRHRRIEALAGLHFMPHRLVFEKDDKSTHIPHMTLDPIFLSPFNSLQEELEDNLAYLGPLRERPRRAYLHSGNPMTEIGESGQYAAQILWLEKDRRVTYLPARTSEPREVTLMEAVNDAFVNLGMLQPVDVKSEKSIMYQILFRIEGSKAREAVTIADVGFGVSQLLPILVLGLRSDASSILLLEQPEIHLHPKLQANLADFLLTLAQQERRLIVETHSDHFINRLRRRIAEDPTDELRNKVNILFVHPPHDGEGATIEPLRVDRFGVIENWPPGFLPEAADEAEAIFLAGLQKRGG